MLWVKSFSPVEFSCSTLLIFVSDSPQAKKFDV